MTSVDLTAVLPLIVLAGTALLLLTIIALKRHALVTAVLTVAGFVAGLCMLAMNHSMLPHPIGHLLLMDGYAWYYTGLLILCALIVALFAYSYFAMVPDTHDEFYVLLILATLGAAVLVASTHFASFFLGLEILSASLYGIVAFRRDRDVGVEAGIKYLILAGVSSAVLLFGMALVYAESGTMSLPALAGSLAGNAWHSVVALTGISMILVGIGFKLAFPPFHLWTPDVYQGAPAPATAFIATVSKVSVFALLLRYALTFGTPASPLYLALTVCAILAMFVGNLSALTQTNLKRLLAYSSIAQMGYLLVALLAGGMAGTVAATFYVTAYVLMSLAAFGVITMLSHGAQEAEEIAAIRTLAWTHPWLAMVLTTALLSLAGIPVTIGFMGKFTILAAGVASNLWLLAILMVINTGISLYYYLRVVAAMFARPTPDPDVPATRPKLTRLGGALLSVLVIALVFLGIYPTPIFQAIQQAIALMR